MSDNLNKISRQKINSKWIYIRNPNLIENLSDIMLSNREQEALSSGLKFATKIHKGDIEDTIMKNHKHNDSEFTKDFIQSIITTTIKNTNENTLPLRYRNALKNLARNKEIHITLSDKGGEGIVIMNKKTYIEKLTISKV